MLSRKVDIRIMAHPSRKSTVIEILKELNLPEEVVSWDDRENGGDAMYTARKAWQFPIPEGCTHRLVLQDDIEVCNSLCEIIESIAICHPDEIVTLFHCETYSSDKRYEEISKIYGCGIMIPVKLLDDLWYFVDNEIDKWIANANEIAKIDTNCILAWSIIKKIPKITTVPSLLQHIGDISLVGIDKQRVSPDFEKNPPLTDW